MLTTRAALGGPWAANLPGVALLFFPSVLLVLLQESTTPFPTWIILLLSILAQFIAGFLPVLVAMIVRGASPKPIPVAAAYSIWISTAVLRGLAGGFIAHTYAGVPADYLVRIGFWLTLALIWMPVFTYALAQWEHRRTLLGVFDGEVERLADEIERGERATSELRQQLVTTVRDAVAPVIEEIRRSLAAVATDLDNDTIRSIGGRIAIVAADAARIVDNAGHSRRRHVAESPHVAGTRAIFINVASPIVTAAVTGLLIAPLAIPIAFGQSAADGWEIVVAIAVISLTLAIAFRARQLRPERSHGNGLVYVVVTSTLAGLAGSLTLAILPWSPMDAPSLVIALVLPVGVAMCGSTIGSIIGVADANRQLSERIELIRADVELHAAQSDAEERLVREQLSSVLHGPVQGRLSACVMALNFHESSRGGSTPGRTEFITTAVLNHLEAASVDLDALAESAH